MNGIKVVPFIFSFSLIIGGTAIATEQTPPDQSKILSTETLLKLLPSDADRNNLKRQERAVRKGFYWTKNRIIRPLDHQPSPS